MTTIDRDEVLAAGVDDWVHTPELSWLVRRNDKSISEREALQMVVPVISGLIRDGLVAVGTVAHEGFVPWAGSVDEVLAKLQSAVDNATYPVQIGDLFWLCNTPAGDDRGKGRSDRSEPDGS